MRLGTPTWMAASPMPGASYMVSNMSATSFLGLRIDRLDRFGDEPQPLVGQDQDVAQGHDRDVSGGPKAVNALRRWRRAALHA